MRSSWADLYDRVKDRRYGTLFMFTMAGLGCFTIVMGVIFQSDFRDSFVTALPVAGIFACFLGAFAIRQALSGRRKPPELSRMSSDEVTKARSKLLKNRERTSP